MKKLLLLIPIIIFLVWGLAPEEKTIVEEVLDPEIALGADDSVHQAIFSATNTAATTNWTVPSGVTSATFEAWAGGGGGSRNSGAGGGGSYMKKVETVSASQVYTMTAGAGGAGGNPLGSNGASSTVALVFGSTILIAPPGLAGGSPGLGAGGLASKGTGDSGFDGGDGGQGTGTRTGGGGAGSTQAGTNGGASGTIGAGGDYYGGLSPSNASTNNRRYSSGGGSLAAGERAGRSGIARVTYDTDVGSGYPVVKSRAAGHSEANQTTHPISMPSNVAVGDLLLFVITSNGAATFTDPDGWTRLDSAGVTTIVQSAVFYTVATSTSPALTIETNTSEATTHLALRMDNAGTPLSASSTSTTGDIDPPSLDTGSSAKYYFITTASIDRSAGGSVSSPPNNYQDFLYLSHPELNAGTADTAIAGRHAETQTEDPGTFTNESNEWVSFTIAVPFLSDGGGGGGEVQNVQDVFWFD